MTLIHHLVPRGELEACLDERAYTPKRFGLDGFVHCTSEPEVTRMVARDYFGDLDGELLVLRIDPDALSSEVRFEAPAPLTGGGDHLRAARVFPHVYGPIDRVAIVGIAVLVEAWPTEWLTLEEVTGRPPPG